MIDLPYLVSAFGEEEGRTYHRALYFSLRERKIGVMLPEYSEDFVASDLQTHVLLGSFLYLHHSITSTAAIHLSAKLRDPMVLG